MSLTENSRLVTHTPIPIIRLYWWGKLRTRDLRSRDIYNHSIFPINLSAIYTLRDTAIFWAIIYRFRAQQEFKCKCRWRFFFFNLLILLFWIALSHFIQWTLWLFSLIKNIVNKFYLIITLLDTSIPQYYVPMSVKPTCTNSINVNLVLFLKHVFND